MLVFLMGIENIDARCKLEELYLKYHKEMYYIAIGILNNTHDAQDAVQSSILKLVSYIEKINEVNSNKTKHLIATIVRNTSIDIYRHKQKHQFIDFDDVQSEIVDKAISFDDLVLRLEDAKWIASKISELKIEYTEVLTLKYYHEFHDLEIADLLNISCENVRIRLYRAKSALRKLLKNSTEEFK